MNISQMVDDILDQYNLGLALQPETILSIKLSAELAWLARVPAPEIMSMVRTYLREHKCATAVE